MFVDSLKIMLGNPKLAILLYNSMNDYKEIEKIFHERLKKYDFYDKFIFKNQEYNDSKYFEKNFFSIFFISIFRQVRFEKDKIMKYGLIFHMIREIVTCTDNILDNEEKGTLLLNADISPIIKNVILILISESIMEKETHKEESGVKLINTLYNIAYGESMARVKDYENYPKSDYIRNIVHKNIGGELLGIALDVPILEENNIETALEKYRVGVVKIGLALQALDDMTDVIEDIEEDKANLLTALILENNNKKYKDLIEKKVEISKVYEKDYIMLIKEAIQNALEGFGIMEDIKYPVNQKQAKNILKVMFKLRGLEKEWELSEK